MCAQIDELPDSQEGEGGGKGNLLIILLALLLAPAISGVVTFFIIKTLKPEETEKPQIVEGGQPLDIEPTGDEKYFELKDLITNLGGPVKARYIDIEIKMEGLAGDFEKILEQNEHRVRDKALTILGNYTYEDASLDGFQERVRIDLKKGFSSVLRKYRDGESDLVRQLYFTSFVIQ